MSKFIKTYKEEFINTDHVVIFEVQKSCSSCDNKSYEIVAKMRHTSPYDEVVMFRGYISEQDAKTSLMSVMMQKGLA